MREEAFDVQAPSRVHPPNQWGFPLPHSSNAPQTGEKDEKLHARLSPLWGALLTGN